MPKSEWMNASDWLSEEHATRVRRLGDPYASRNYTGTALDVSSKLRAAKRVEESADAESVKP